MNTDVGARRWSEAIHHGDKRSSHQEKGRAPGVRPVAAADVGRGAADNGVASTRCALERSHPPRRQAIIAPGKRARTGLSAIDEYKMNTDCGCRYGNGVATVDEHTVNTDVGAQRWSG